jgi:uncharacterized repeat protein (TIGR03943 family)
VSAAGGTITLLVGVVLLRLTLTGVYTRYVRPGLGPWLVVAGAAVIVLGSVTLIRSVRRERPVDAHDHGAEGDRVGWLLLAPIAALLLVAPPTLGSYGVDRAVAVDVRAGASVFDPLDPESGPVPMTLLEFGQRAYDHAGASFHGVPVTLTGFVVSQEPGGFRLARYQIACCAADAAPVLVRVVGVAGDAPARDRWVTVSGTFSPGGVALPELAATSVVEIPVPDDPYE